MNLRALVPGVAVLLFNLLSPLLVTAQGHPPVAVARVLHSSHLFAWTSDVRYLVISPLPFPGEFPVVFDASASFDPEGGALRFEWAELDEGEHAFAHTMRATNYFRGDDLDSAHRVQLTVIDPDGNRSEQVIHLTVVSPNELVANIAEFLDASAIPHRAKRLLMYALNSAHQSLEKGDSIRALHFLQLFERTAKHLAHVQPTPAIHFSVSAIDELIRAMQAYQRATTR